MEPSISVASLAVKGTISAIWSLLKKPLELVTQLLFRAAYEVSTLHRSHRDMKGLWRGQLGDYFAYSVNWNKLFLGKEQQACTLWIKANEGRSFRRATLCVTASLETLRYQSTVTLYDVGKTPTVAAVPSIPLRQVEVRGNMVHVPYDTVRTELKELIDENGEPIPLSRKVTNYGHPFDNLEAAMGRRKSDVLRWGKWWNLDFLEGEKNDFRVRYRGLAFLADYQGQKTARAWYSLLAWLSNRDWFLEACFWSRNLVTANQLRQAFKKSIGSDS
ncbi:hypothetical protein [Paraburkholderia terricola]|uniref:hypothetical protein n=1 Tax=Paraburkholderia terricola TaxID=169427 RepID=UPI0028652999|nr:hypothetical protein [Paraburkholderia terricola]MDR6485345.1 hypothetical protein [Paraburkholderia terricola]